MSEKESLLVLSNKELNAIRLNTEELKVLEKDRTIIELKNQLLSVQDALLEAQKEVIKRDRIILEYHTIQLDKNVVVMKDRNKDELVEISKHYEGLEGKKWGYNPETGEIIINEEDLQTIPLRKEETEISK